MGSRIRFTRAKQVFETYPELSETVKEPASDIAPQDYTLELRDGDAPLTALAYFAHVLPKREAVWWGMKCVAGLDGPGTPDDRQVLVLSETWVREGDEDARAAVHAAAEAARTESAAVWIGLAAGWSGGSLSPNPEHRVEMPDDLTAKAVNTALLIALGTVEPDKRDEALNSCLSAGLSFAEGGSMPTVSLNGQAPANS
ncbi:hypothetical protein [uncultured Roseibium sp.]|uniref:DUF6931 family protein n=1 Tax=uncultured Roseibium sp. TaxID=1936171 RepID=UPI002636BD88|nr:hypothetical protein [uncultured Roseibium sp.]